MIQVEQVTKIYNHGTQLRALDNINLRINEGEFVAISGPSGSGKTTLLNLLGALDSPTQGAIHIAGAALHGLQGDALADFRRTHLGFVFQLFNLIPHLTVLENILLPLLPYRRTLAFDGEARAATLLEQVGLRARRHHLACELSGGEQQRVAIARALINAPRIILADEPTGNLDTENGQAILGLLQQVHAEKRVTLVLVTHNAEISAQAQRVIVLRDGRVV